MKWAEELKREYSKIAEVNSAGNNTKNFDCQKSDTQKIGRSM